MHAYKKLVDYHFSAEITVLGGLPVRACFTAHDDGEPDGWMIDDITGYRSAKTGKPLGKWVERRIAESKHEDDDRIQRKIYEASWEDEDYFPNDEPGDDD